MTHDITIFAAKKIVTMNPSNPEGTHVAVRDGRILGVGPLAELAGWGEYTLDETFKRKVLIPGLVEAHSHVTEGASWANPYVGYFDRTDPDGKVWPGSQTQDAVLERLSEIDAEMTDPDTLLMAWGLDPIYFEGERLVAKHLDLVSTTRPIFVLHANSHVATVNSACLRMAGIDRDCDVVGVLRDPDGEPNGELSEFAAMFLVVPAAERLAAAMGSEDSVRGFGRLAVRTGCTTVTELGTAPLYNPDVVALYQKVVNDQAFAPRLVMYYGASFGGPQDPEEISALVKELRRSDSDKLRVGGIKMYLDGSIQGFSACVAWPGYYTGEHEGIWDVGPEQFAERLAVYHRAGINVHTHCNGEQAIQLFIDKTEEVLRDCAWLDHRHTVQHSALATSAQYRKMAKLGLCANLFINHMWYWADQHYELTVGPERAKRMNSCATAGREGVKYSFHSDAAITPLGSLHTMWCAVTRRTPKGRVLGKTERISAYDALYAATIGAAYQLHLDDQIGSIECGKFADFAVLDASPLAVSPRAIKDIPVWGTVVGGVKYQAT
ncbi:amidohydrolase [Nocardia sp. GCM10030253]|uniref:amidohydrolase n=1 Tax=Nocardia sp. GCM10030253 TaxID=3273404 RepID=UPI00363BF92A